MREKMIKIVGYGLILAVLFGVTIKPIYAHNIKSGAASVVNTAVLPTYRLLN